MVRRLAPLLALALAACSPAPAREAVPAGPAIVSLNPCTDAILAEVADPGQILAISAYSHDPSSSSMDLAMARRFPAVSGTVEEVVALRPDLVIGSTFMPPASVAALGGLGLPLEQFGMAATVHESIAQVRRIAALAGHPDRGEALVRRIEAALVANAAPPGAPVSALVWQLGGIVPGEGTLIVDLLRRTGFANAAAARGLGQADMLPLEALIAAPPALILSASHGAGEDERMLGHPALTALGGVRREPLDPSLLWCGGPTIIRAADRLGAVRRSFETGLRLRSVPPQDERLPNRIAHPEERSGLSQSKAAKRLEG